MLLLEVRATQVEGALQEYRDTRLTRSAAVQARAMRTLYMHRYVVHAYYYDCIPCMVYMHSTHTACNHVTRSMVHAHAHVHVHCTRATPLGHMQGLCYSHPHAPPHPVIGPLPLRERHHHPRLRHAVQAGLLRRCGPYSIIWPRTVVSSALIISIALRAVWPSMRCQLCSSPSTSTTPRPRPALTLTLRSSLDHIPLVPAAFRRLIEG